MRKTLEAISLAALAVLFWSTWRALSGPGQLPDRIPTHFDLAGHADGWGSPQALLMVPAVAFVLYLGITLVARFPAVFNYPVRVTPENRRRLEELALNMICWLKTELVCLFAWLQILTIDAARRSGPKPSVNFALVPVSIVVVFATVGWHFVAMRRAASPRTGA